MKNVKCANEHKPKCMKTNLHFAFRKIRMLKTTPKKVVLT